MLSRQYRFHGHNSVRRVYKSGQPVRNVLGSAHVVRGEKVHSTKVAIVVSRKVDKSAVRRNRIRRRLYELCRQHLPALRTQAEIVLTIYQNDALTLPPETLNAQLVDLLKKAKLV